MNLKKKKGQKGLGFGGKGNGGGLSFKERAHGIA